MRTIIDLTERQVKMLAEICEQEKISRAEAIRRAVDDYLKKTSKSTKGKHDPAFGLWKDRDIDGVEYQRKLRKEWDRDESPV